MRFRAKDMRTGLVGLAIFVVLAVPEELPAGEAGKAWPAEWEKTVSLAKKEGRLTIYTARNQSEIVNGGAFQKKYPEIKVSQLVLQSGIGLQRVLSERRAGHYLVDIRLGGSGDGELSRIKALEPITPALILPEVIDESKWWLGRHHFEDSERYILLYIGAPAGVTIYYNTRLVDPKEIRSLSDLLHPRWKAKIVTYDARGGGAGGGTLRFIYHHPRLGPDFLRRLFRETQMTFTRDYRRQATDWLATGKFAICFICNFTEIQRAKAQGLPVDALSFETIEGVAGLTGEGGSVSLMNRAPHPNAAKVFINWLLSREGQIAAQRALSKGQASDSLRIDIPKDDVPPGNRRMDGVEYIDLRHPSRLDMRPIYKIIEEAAG